MAQRGLESYQEQNQQRIIRDTRTLGQKTMAFIRDPKGTFFILILFVVSSFVLAYLADVFFILGVIIFLICVLGKSKLPFRMPERSGMKDYNDLHPATGKAVKSRGIYHFGNQLKTMEELWFSNDDMRTHVLVFGSTGSGKTEFLLGLAYNALVQSSGFIYVDGKGDNSLFAKIFSMCRSMGREDDLLLINFMTGARDIVGPQKNRLSNTLNPFASGSSSMLSNLVVSLMESGSSGGGDGDMWKGRAISFVEALMRVLVAVRDRGDLLLDANTIRNYFMIDRIEAMVMDKVLIRDDQEPVSLEDLDKTILDPINMYLFNLPGYNKEKKGKQVSQVLEQHGFITMQLTRSFSSLADTYGHILRTNLAEVDLQDVVLNRRILVVLLPALEKSPAELSNLGKVIIATLKCMMASGLGDGVEGEYKDLIESKPTNAKTPFLCILDEYGYYAVEGFAVVPAQARSLGFSVVFAGQDYPAFQKASKEEAASIGANTNIKMCMKLEDPTETWDFFNKTAGESYVTQVESFNIGESSLLGNYRDTKSARLEKRSRIDLLDLKDQYPGDAHIFFKSTVIRMKVFYPNPKPVKTLRINHFLKIDKPEDEFVQDLSQSIQGFEKKVKEDSLSFTDVKLEDSVVEIQKDIQSFDANMPLLDKILLALNKEAGENGIAGGLESPIALDEENTSELNVFSGTRYVPYYDGVLIADNVETFLKPFLNKAELVDGIGLIERLFGASGKKSSTLAHDMVKDMRSKTLYTFNGLDSKPPSEELVNLVELLIKDISKEKKEKSNKENQ